MAETGLALGRRRAQLARAAAAWALALLAGSAPVLAPLPARAGEAQPLAADPLLEARVMALAGELRCVVCQNETLAASQAELARDLRAQIRAQLREGRSEAQVRDFMVARYGQFVLYRPPLQASTGLLWLGPFALLALAALAWRRQLRPAHEPNAPNAPVSDGQEKPAS